MTTKSSKGNFIAKEGDENSVTILRTGSTLFQIGFVSEDGEFFLDTNNEQVLLHTDDMRELHDLIHAVVFEMENN